MSQKDDWYTGYKKSRKVKFGPIRKNRFLEAYSHNGLFGEAAKAAGICATTARAHMESDPLFAEAMDAAELCYVDRLRNHQQDLVFNGAKTPIIGGENRDQIIGYKTDYPVQLIAMELKKHDPGYRDKQQVDHNVVHGVLVVPGVASLPEHRKQLEDHRERTQQDAIEFRHTIEGQIVKD